VQMASPVSCQEITVNMIRDLQVTTFIE
jgi:hypothetical protein